MASLRCPECYAPDAGIIHTTHRLEPAPWWMRVLNRAGWILPLTVKRVSGYRVRCQVPRCGCEYLVTPEGARKLEARSLPPNPDIAAGGQQSTDATGIRRLGDAPPSVHTVAAGFPFRRQG